MRVKLACRLGWRPGGADIQVGALGAGGGYGGCMARSAPLALCGALAICGVLAMCTALAPATAAPSPAAPPTATSAILRSSFSPDRLGGRGTLTFSIRYIGGAPSAFFPGGPRVPSPVRRLAVHLPAGSGLDIPNLRSCSVARLRAHGARGCPAASRIGRGFSLTELAAGSQVLSERLTLSVYVGPPRNGQPTLAILARGYTPLGERLVFKGEMRFDRPPYGEELVMNLPSFHALPETPDSSPVVLSLTLGVRRHGRSSQANTVIVPSRCPAGGFPFAADSTYADGSSGSAKARALCP